LDIAAGDGTSSDGVEGVTGVGGLSLDSLVLKMAEIVKYQMKEKTSVLQRSCSVY
jgi:hypothetical protein